MKEGDMDVQIRKADAADGPAIAELLRSLGLFARIQAEAPQMTQERVARHLALCAADDSHLVLVAQAPDGEIAGYGAVHWLPYLILAGPEGYVSELFVRDACRGHGIGRQLLEVVKAEARSRGCARLMLLNMRARESYQRQFYAKQGWEERPDAANFVLRLDSAT
jgi:GNAT superfamily N-acetyltransferase